MTKRLLNHNNLKQIIYSWLARTAEKALLVATPLETHSACSLKARAKAAKEHPRKLPNNHSSPCSSQWDNKTWWTKALEACNNSNSNPCKASNPKWIWINNSPSNSNSSSVANLASTNKDFNLTWECSNHRTRWVMASSPRITKCSSSNRCTTNNRTSRTLGSDSSLDECTLF